MEIIQGYEPANFSSGELEIVRLLRVAISELFERVFLEQQQFYLSSSERVARSESCEVEFSRVAPPNAFYCVIRIAVGSSFEHYRCCIIGIAGKTGEPPKILDVWKKLKQGCSGQGVRVEEPVPKKASPEALVSFGYNASLPKVPPGLWIAFGRLYPNVRVKGVLEFGDFEPGLPQIKEIRPVRHDGKRRIFFLVTLHGSLEERKCSFSAEGGTAEDVFTLFESEYNWYCEGVRRGEELRRKGDFLSNKPLGPEAPGFSLLHNREMTEEMSGACDLLLSLKPKKLRQQWKNSWLTYVDFPPGSAEALSLRSLCLEKSVPLAAYDLLSQWYICHADGHAAQVCFHTSGLADGDSPEAFGVSMIVAVSGVAIR